MVHDFKTFPELTTAQMRDDYFNSPHRQITESFTARVIKVHDGDTVTVRWPDRDFDFPVRMLDIAAPELNEKGGQEAKNWLESKVLGEEIYIHVDPANRVEKWGRLLGKIYLQGIPIGDEESIVTESTPWEQRHDGKIAPFKNPMASAVKQWA